jgi:hypothetical protein
VFTVWLHCVPQVLLREVPDAWQLLQAQALELRGGLRLRPLRDVLVWRLEPMGPRGQQHAW